MSDIKTLQAELKTMQESHRAAQKALREEIKTLKASAEKDGLGKLQRFQAGIDNVLLRMCKPFEKMAADIKYKKSNPEGYEADQMIDKAEMIVGMFAKRVEKGKQLTQENVDLLIRLETALGVIEQRQLGKRCNEVVNLQGKIRALLPSEVKNQMNTMDDMLSKMNEMMAGLVKPPSQEN